MFFGPQTIQLIIALLIAISVHEAAHAYAAYLLGDPTAKYEGRLTLNPLAHLDFFGTLALILVGFGWGKPVPYNPRNLRNPKKDGLLIALAGPMSNLATALVFSLPYNFLFKTSGNFMEYLLITIIQLNLILMTFNLLPIHPLDGSKIVIAFTPERYHVQLVRFLELGPAILFSLIIVEHLTSLSIFWAFISPVVNFFWIAINFST